jgi:hypothetical protein
MRYVSPLFGDHERNLTTEDLSLLLGLKRIEHLADRGRWLLFISVLLLVIEFFAVLAMLIESRGQMYMVAVVNHGYVIGGFIYLLVSVLAVIFSVRLVSAEKSLSFQIRLSASKPGSTRSFRLTQNKRSASCSI